MEQDTSLLPRAAESYAQQIAFEQTFRALGSPQLRHCALNAASYFLRRGRGVLRAGIRISPRSILLRISSSSRRMGAAHRASGSRLG